MRAIKETGNRLLAALDKNDSVGILDRYFPEADFFTEFERFDRHCEKLKRSSTPVNYVSVCTPNYLHDAHIRFGLRIGADVICEKPVVLNPWNVDALMDMEKETGRKIYSILQLRLHPAVQLLRQRITEAPAGKRHTIELKYITPRGRWYQRSWKGDTEKSGGIVTNIGLHFFDMLLWIFGDVKEVRVEELTAARASGILVLEKADVQWMLSIDEKDLPLLAREKNNLSYRSLHIDKEEYEFSNGFDDLHTESYERILTGKGMPIQSTRNVIQLLHDIRNAK
jgi:UDP-N-acetyl-2-amino-2-deoxyglucuronate dehydrogenase